MPGKQGFASMDPERRAEISKRAAQASKTAYETEGKGHRWDSEEAQKAGKKGGYRLLWAMGHQHMIDIGRIGGSANASTETEE